MEFIVVAIIVIFLILYNGKIDTKKFVKDNETYFKMLKEKDYEFYLRAKYGEKYDPEKRFMKRINNGLMGTLFAFIILMVVMGANVVSIILSFIIGYFIFKNEYNSLKGFYKKHLHEIDMLLPYYLKSLEILVQHYTVPVALGKSMESAPEQFKFALNNLITKINAGDSSIDPYMDFAKEFPVRDSMRMMRLLFRLGLGADENKQEHLNTLSKTVSSLQNKSRQMKYKARLDKMEKQTLIMLVGTGGLSMLLIFLAIIENIAV